MKKLISSRFSINNESELLHQHRSTQIPLISQVKSKIKDGSYHLQNYSCSCGQEQENLIISEVDRYGIPLNSVLCLNCGTVRLEPYLDDPSLSDFYTAYYQDMYARAMDSEAYFHRQASYGQKVLSGYQNLLNQNSWICEIGCGAGGSLKVFQHQGYQVVGCDYSNELLEFGKTKGLNHLYYGSLSEVGKALPDVKFDLIYLHHVFEHLNEPLSFLIDCRDYLTDEGKIVIAIPDISKIDVAKFPAGDLLPYLHIAHKYNFSFECLKQLGNLSGYTISEPKLNFKIKTPCSESAELWVEFKKITKNSFKQPLEILSKEKGEKMLSYLQRTEKLYSWGLCKAQLFNKFDNFVAFLTKKINHFIYGIRVRLSQVKSFIKTIVKT